MTVHCLHIILLNGHGYMPFITSTTGMTPRGEDSMFGVST